jgi:hypothetical protein
LDLIDDDRSSERTQYGIRFVEAGKACGIFEIEVVERMRRHELPSERGLAALTRAQERDYAAAFQSCLN